MPESAWAALRACDAVSRNSGDAATSPPFCKLVSIPPDERGKSSGLPGSVFWDRWRVSDKFSNLTWVKEREVAMN